jgi:hypothetical protein
MTGARSLLVRIRFSAGLAVAVGAVLGLYVAGAVGAPAGQRLAVAAGTGVVANVEGGTAGIDYYEMDVTAKFTRSALRRP